MIIKVTRTIPVKDKFQIPLILFTYCLLALVSKRQNVNVLLCRTHDAKNGEMHGKKNIKCITNISQNSGIILHLI